MTTTLLLSFIPYLIIMNYTPGPANILSLSTSSRYGFRTFLKVLTGLFSGFMCDMLFALGFTLGFSFLLPSAEKMLTYLGSFYILWLAWHIFSSPINAPNASKTEIKKDKSPAFLTGFFIQLCNIKVILYGITIYSVYLIPTFGARIPQLLLCIPLLALIGASSCILWALLGTLLQHVLNQYAKISNTIMALMLLICAGEIVFF